MNAPSRGVALVVDDEASLRTVLRLTLAGQGYRVLEAAGIASALAAAQPELAELKLALIDVNLAGESGLALADQLLALAPELPILMLSGAYPADLATWVAAHPHAGFLAKPFVRKDLLEAIAKLQV